MPSETATGTATSYPTQTSTSVPTYTRTPTATSTSASVTPTAGQPTATQTSCPLQYTDVPVGSAFYPYIRCLSCRGIVSGYSDHTFRPGNNVTRGEIAKIVSNAAGFHDAITGQQFQDVPPGSDFYVYVGRLVARNLIGGYSCGGPGERCVPLANLPYFRPYSDATRGQISKVVSNAAGFSDTPSGQQFQVTARRLADLLHLHL